MKKKKTAKPSFRKSRKHTDKPPRESIHSSTNQNSGPANPADEALRHMMKYKPAGLKQTQRQKK